VRCDCCGSASWHELFSENGVHLGQCPDCDLLYIKEMPAGDSRMTEIEEGHYAGTQEMLSAARQLEGERILEARFQAFVDLARKHVDGGRWLDIGCGAGLLLQLARRDGFEPEGLELNADRRATAERVGGFPVHGVPVEEAGIPDDHFDVVSMINVFSHLVSPGQTFEELRRIVRPGGVVVMATGEMTAGVQKSHMLTWNLGDHLYFLGDRTMERYADRLGFDVVHHDRRWLPDEMFTREWLRSHGRSRQKNAVKTVIDKTPGGLRLLRAVMLRRQADSKAHAGVFVLRFD
jgi:SAM-dependent methyltransferase